jgi:para-nitrobenzyl esterase
VPYNMMVAYESGRFAHVPIMIGTNTADRGLNFSRSKDELFAAFGDQAANARAVYDPTGATDIGFLRLSEGADEMMHEPARFTARAFSRQGLPAYVFRFGYVAEGLRNIMPGAVHGAEIPYVMDTLSTVLGSAATPADLAAATTVSAYWVAFAKTGNPNGGGRPVWDAFTPSDQRILMIEDAGIASKADPWASRLDAVETINKKIQE